MSKTIRYKTAPNHGIATACPYGMRNPIEHRIILVNTIPCWHCQYYGRSNYPDSSIECNHP